MPLVFTKMFARLRNLKPIRGALADVLASFDGLLAVVNLQLGSVVAHNTCGVCLCRVGVCRRALIQT